MDDTKRLDWVLALLDGTLVPEEAERRFDVLQGGRECKLTGRVLLDSCMNAVRFDETPEVATQLVEQMIAERTDTQRLDLLQAVLPDLAYVNNFGDWAEVQLDGAKRYINGKGVTLRAALDNLADRLAAEEARQ